MFEKLHKELMDDIIEGTTSISVLERNKFDLMKKMNLESKKCQILLNADYE
jgi:hypothetical protein